MSQGGCSWMGAPGGCHWVGVPVQVSLSGGPWVGPPEWMSLCSCPWVGILWWVPLGGSSCAAVPEWVSLGGWLCVGEHERPFTGAPVGVRDAAPLGGSYRDTSAASAAPAARGSLPTGAVSERGWRCRQVAARGSAGRGLRCPVPRR